MNSDGNRWCNGTIARRAETFRLGAHCLQPAGILLLVGLAALLTAVSSFAVPTNSMCPVLTDEPADSNITVIYQGQQIAFCCRKCRRQFLAEPEKFAANPVSFALIEQGGNQSVDGLSDNHDTITGESETEDTSAAQSPAHDDDESVQEHDHAADHAQASSRAWTFLGKFHPVIVHFPVALLVTACLIALAASIRPSVILNLVSIKMVYFAAAGAVVAALLGLAAGADAHYPVELMGHFKQHRTLGLATGALSLVVAGAAYLAERNASAIRIGLFRVVLLLASVLVGVTAHWGAVLVYGPGHFTF